MSDVLCVLVSDVLRALLSVVDPAEELFRLGDVAAAAAGTSRAGFIFQHFLTTFFGLLPRASTM